jgi:hypothetical protein
VRRNLAAQDKLAVELARPRQMADAAPTPRTVSGVRRSRVVGQLSLFAVEEVHIPVSTSDDCTTGERVDEATAERRSGWTPGTTASPDACDYKSSWYAATRSGDGQLPGQVVDGPAGRVARAGPD